MELIAFIDKGSIESDFMATKDSYSANRQNWFALRTFPRHDKTSELALFIWLIGKVHVVDVSHGNSSFMQTSSTFHGQE